MFFAFSDEPRNGGRIDRLSLNHPLETVITAANYI